MREVVDAASEAAFLGLRLNAGVDTRAFEIVYGLNVEEKYDVELSELKDAGLLESVEGRLRLTRKGKLLSNEVFAVFV
jgi:oxygen-independent coproporphyrinogen-3 oxidase